MNVFTIKPQIKFPLNLAIYRWIEEAYEKVETQEDLVKFMHWCLNEAMVSKNEVRKNAFLSIGNTMYSLLTGKSYESK